MKAQLLNLSIPRSALGPARQICFTSRLTKWASLYSSHRVFSCITAVFQYPWRNNFWTMYPEIFLYLIQCAVRNCELVNYDLCSRIKGLHSENLTCVCPMGKAKNAGQWKLWKWFRVYLRRFPHVLICLIQGTPAHLQKVGGQPDFKLWAWNRGSAFFTRFSICSKMASNAGRQFFRTAQRFSRAGKVWLLCDNLLRSGPGQVGWKLSVFDLSAVCVDEITVRRWVSVCLILGRARSTRRLFHFLFIQGHRRQFSEFTFGPGIAGGDAKNAP